MDVMMRLALATDDEVEGALQVLLKGFTIARPEIAPVIEDERELRELLKREASEALSAENEPKGKALRAVAVQLARNAEFASRVDAALDARKKLIEPVTTALVLAGIVMLLSTEFDIEHKNVDGKRSTTIHLQKKATSDDILKKFFGLFGK